MTLIVHLMALVLIGCASSPEQQPMAIKPEEPFRRVVASKDDLLYNYHLGIQYPNLFERAEADANTWCKRKYNLAAAQRTQPQCGVYINQGQQDQVCTVAFKCL